MIVATPHDTLTVLRMEHGKVNALDVELSEALVSELAALAAGPAEAVVLTGAGSSFSAGVDLVQVAAGGAAYVARFLPVMDALFHAVLTFPKPLVAAVNGHAIAGGCILAAACDRVIMADGPGLVGVTELAVGVPFPMLPLEMVRARVPERDFRDLVFSARTVGAAEACRLGLVDEIVDAGRLEPAAIDAARRLAAILPVSFALTKRALVAPILERSRHGAAIDAAVTRAWASDEVQARIRAFLDRRARR